MAICTTPDRHEFGTGFRWQVGAAHEPAPDDLTREARRIGPGDRSAHDRVYAVRADQGIAGQPHARLRLDGHAVRFLRDGCDAVTQVDLDGRASAGCIHQHSPEIAAMQVVRSRAEANLEGWVECPLDDDPSTLAASQPHAALRVPQWRQNGVDSQRGENPRAVRTTTMVRPPFTESADRAGVDPGRPGDSVSGRVRGH